MPRILLFFSIILSVLIICSSCETIKVITAKDHKPGIQNPESIRTFAKKHHIDGYPIIRFDPSYYTNEDGIGMGFYMYNTEGKYLSLKNDTPGCPDKLQQYISMRYILQNGDEHYIRDSLSVIQGTLKDPNTDITTMDWNKLRKDTSLWERQTITYSADLENYVSFFRTLEGEVVDIYSLYSDYLLLYEYQMSGKSSFDCILIREKIRDIQKLNKEFGPRIQLVLINMDQME